MPPLSASAIESAIGSGQLVLRRAAFLDVTIDSAGTRIVRILSKGAQDPEQNASPLIADLLASGQARVDQLRIGLDVGQDCRLVVRSGRPSRRIIAIGPASRAAFWEITAIPDIREQVAKLAHDLAAIPRETVKTGSRASYQSQGKLSAQCAGLKLYPSRIVNESC